MVLPVLFNKSETTQNEEAYIHANHIVTKGSIRMMQPKDGHHEMFLYYINPGETCTMSFLGGIQQEKNKVTAVAKEEAEVLKIPIEKVDQLDLPDYYTRF